MSLNALCMEDYDIVVAIDYGTTFSGCAYSVIGKKNTPMLIDNWLEQRGRYGKAPSVVYYRKTPDGGRQMVAWGWVSSSDDILYSGSDYEKLEQYKLHLDDSGAIALPDLRSPLPVYEVISDYLRCLLDYIEEQIKLEVGDYLDREKYRYCLTVPAMWSDRAKDTMRRAAIRAGLVSKYDHQDRLLLVSEPEAAALFCERECPEYFLENNDRFLLCDAGGGTVDLIVYDVAESKDGRTLSEVTEGQGQLCGSVFLDRNFRQYVKELFGNVEIPDDVLTDMVNKFTYDIKPYFLGGEKDQYLRPSQSDFFSSLKNPSDFGIHSNVMTLTASVLKEKIFDPVIQDVLGLISDQLHRANQQVKQVKAIVMVGGFSNSGYLLKRVKEEFLGKVKMVVRPNRAETAVVSGAVYAALTPRKVTSRVTRRCYGIGCTSVFDLDLDPAAFAVKVGDVYHCRNRFSTFIQKDVSVKLDESISHTYMMTKTRSDGPNLFRVPIYVLDEDEPPRYDVGLEESAYISIPDPFEASDPVGKKIMSTLTFFFAITEIKIDIKFRDKVYRARLEYDDNSPTTAYSGSKASKLLANLKKLRASKSHKIRMSEKPTKNPHAKEI